MLKFVFQKIRKKKWMFLSLLIGNLLMIAVVIANPMYSQAVMQRTLTQNLGSQMEQTGQYPTTLHIRNLPYRQFNIHSLDAYTERVNALTQALGQPPVHTVTRYGFEGLTAAGATPDERLTVQLACYSQAEDHIRLLHGQMYSTALDESNTFDVVVSQRTFVEQSLMLGQEFTLSGLKTDDGTPLRVRIAGIIQASDNRDLYWPAEPNQWTNVFLMDEDLFRSLFASKGASTKTPFGQWYMVLDYTQIKADQVDAILSVLDRYTIELEQSQQFRPLSAPFLQTLQTHQQEAHRFQTTVWVLQIPILLLLAVFIFMVSRQMLELEQNEIAVFKSRGASGKQILGLYIRQSLLIAVFSCAIGIPLGVFLCRILGGTNDFLLFVRREALPVEFNWEVLQYALAGALVSACATVLPVLRYCRVTIVDHKRKKNRRRKRSWWKLLCLDLILIAIGLYGLYQYRLQQEALAARFADGAQLDPVLYLYSSVFMLGAGLLFLRLLPLVIRGVFLIGKRLWSPGAYASFLRIIRVEDNQGFMVVFLVLTITLGMFSAQMARSINANAEDKLRYTIGADMVVQEFWSSNADVVYENGATPEKVIYTEPDFGKYMSMENVTQATKVLVDDEAVISESGGLIHNVTLMGIHTKQFGQVAWMKDGLSDRHWYHSLNTLAAAPDAVLVSSNLKTVYGYKLGDTIRYTSGGTNTAQGTICGFVDYWPGYASVNRSKGADGLYTQTDHFLVIAHLSQLQNLWGVTPYQVWLQTDGSSDAFYDYAAEHNLHMESVRDVHRELAALKSDPVLQSTNGILTIGFILVLLLCAVGFLIYWILSIRQRTLQFGIFRAMGMSGREVIFMLLIEQFLISVTSIGAGILVGWLAARLYVPLVQASYAGADKVLPMQIVGSASDYVRLGCVVGAIVIACIVILSVLISRIRITQALKLGED